MQKLIQSLFSARQIAHEFHLRSLSYAEHVALGDFYDSLLELTDDLIETHQGQYGIVNDYLPLKKCDDSNALSFLKNFSNELNTLKSSISSSDTHLLNIFDEIMALVYKTIYKVENLK